MNGNSSRGAKLDLQNAEKKVKEISRALQVAHNDHKILMLMEKLNQAEDSVKAAQARVNFEELAEEFPALITQTSPSELLSKLWTFRSKVEVNVAENDLPKQLSSELLDKIDQKMKELGVPLIKQTILDVGMKYIRLQVVEIAEKCGVPDENLIIATLQDMISRGQIAAEYFKSTKAVAFNQLANIQEKDKFITELEKEFSTWGINAKKNNSK